MFFRRTKSCKPKRKRSSRRGPPSHVLKSRGLSKLKGQSQPEIESLRNSGFRILETWFCLPGFDCDSHGFGFQVQPICGSLPFTSPYTLLGDLKHIYRGFPLGLPFKQNKQRVPSKQGTIPKSEPLKPGVGVQPFEG